MYKCILLPIDLNEESSWRKALPVALECCDAFACELHLMTAVPDFGMSLVGNFFPAGFQQQQREEADRQLQAFVSANVPARHRVQHYVAEGGAYEEILKAADRIGADLIVMASHRPELSDYLIGPNAERVVRHSHHSVLVVRE